MAYKLQAYKKSEPKQIYIIAQNKNKFKEIEVIKEEKNRKQQSAQHTCSSQFVLLNSYIVAVLLLCALLNYMTT